MELHLLAEVIIRENGIPIEHQIRTTLTLSKICNYPEAQLLAYLRSQNIDVIRIDSISSSINPPELWEDEDLLLFYTPV